MTEYSSEFEYGGALQFNGTSIDDLAKAAKEFVRGEDLEISIEFVGDHTIKGSSVSELLDDPYARSSRIKSIKVEGSSYSPREEPPRRIAIRIGRIFDDRINVSIQGDRNACLAVRAQIESLLKGCALSYAGAFRPVGPEYSAARIIGGWLLCCVILAFGHLILSGIPKSSADAIDLGFFAFGLSFTLYYLLSFLRRRMFPALLFDIGKSAERVRSAALYRQIVFVGFFLAVATGIIATLITDRLKG